MRMDHRVRSRPGGRAVAIEERVSKGRTEEPGRAARDLSLDINTAQVSRLKSLTGIGDHYAKKIVEGRPYHNQHKTLLSILNISSEVGCSGALRQ